VHISCPRCDKTINAKNYNLFRIWECPDCEWKFRGVHAGQPVFLNYIYEFISPLNHGPHISDTADCPHCGTMININWIWNDSPSRNFGPFRRKGYNGPYVCRGCRNELPWDYPEQKPHVLKAYNKWAYEYNKKNGLDNSEFENLPELKEEKQKTNEQIENKKEKNRLEELAANWKKDKEEILKKKPFCKKS